MGIEKLEKVFLEKLQKIFKRKIDLELKDNRTVFLNSKKYQSGGLRLILHKAFLFAPKYILLAVKDYVLFGRRKSLKVIRSFMEGYFQKRDYSRVLDKRSLRCRGEFYDLKEILLEVEKKYLGKEFEDLFITFFKKPNYRKFSRITFGSYSSELKLIKINEILDDLFFPKYFVEFIVYHEMLHHIHGEKRGRDGRRSVHTREFREAEKKYSHYEEAKRFEKDFFEGEFLRGKTRNLLR
jgi:hypothetical protein